MTERETARSADEHLEALRASGQVSDEDYAKLRAAMDEVPTMKPVTERAPEPTPIRPRKTATSRLLLATVMAVLVLTAVFLLARPVVHPEVIWDMGASGLLDASNSRYDIVDGTVRVQPLEKLGLCPSGLGNIAEGKPDVDNILIEYDVSQSGLYDLHITWNPGESGQEQFAVSCNDKPVGMSQPREGDGHPGRNTTEVFAVPHKQGRNVLRLRNVSGDGMHFADIILTRDRN